MVGGISFGLVGLTFIGGGITCARISSFAFDCTRGAGLLFCGVVLSTVSLSLVGVAVDVGGDSVSVSVSSVDDEVAWVVFVEEEWDSRVVGAVFPEVGIVGSESVRQYATGRTQGIESWGVVRGNVGTGTVNCGTDISRPPCAWLTKNPIVKPASRAIGPAMSAHLPIVLLSVGDRNGIVFAR